MNPDLIETREDALALVDADLITIQDYIALCGFKGWHPVSAATIPAPASPPEPANRNRRAPEHGVPPSEAMRPRLNAGAARTEPGDPVRARPLGRSLTNA